MIEALAEMIRCETVSDPFSAVPGVPASIRLVGGRPGAFAELHRVLERSFPRLHAALARDVVAETSLLFRWEPDGSIVPTGAVPAPPGTPPILLAAHLDVVPVAEEALDRWTHPPYAGTIADGFVWGRGALDDKVAVAGICTAVERLLGEGFRPRRPVLLAFGADEELGGLDGAARIAAELAARGQRPEIVLDEGGAVTSGLVPFVSRPVALVGVAEKGYVTLELLVRASGGHAFAPPSRTAIGILSSAIARLERSPMPARVQELRHLYEPLAPDLSPPVRLAMRNLRLLGPIVTRRLAREPAANAAVRSTIAVTMAQAGILPQVLAPEARAVVNCRILPADSVDEVVAHVRRAVADERVEVRALEGRFRSDPLPPSSTSSRGWSILASSIAGAFPDARVAPWTLLGATDARHYASVATDVYRFAPIRLGPGDLVRVHGTDERLPVAHAAAIVGFYAAFIRGAAG